MLNFILDPAGIQYATGGGGGYLPPDDPWYNQRGQAGFYHDTFLGEPALDPEVAQAALLIRERRKAGDTDWMIIKRMTSGAPGYMTAAGGAWSMAVLDQALDLANSDGPISMPAPALVKAKGSLMPGVQRMGAPMMLVVGGGVLVLMALLLRGRR